MSAPTPDPTPVSTHPKALFHALYPVALEILNRRFGSKWPVTEASVFSAYTTFARHLQNPQDEEIQEAKTPLELAGVLVQLTLRRHWRREHDDRRWEQQTQRIAGNQGEALPFDPQSTAPDPVQQIETREKEAAMAQAVEQAIQLLDPVCQEVVRLWFQGNGATLQKDISEKLGLSQAKVSRCITRFCDLLFEEFGPQGDA